VVQPGENFWTISRYYYNSGRYYKALWKANQDQVPNIRELYVGTTILVPAPEDLDPAYVLPPSTARNDSAPAIPPSRRGPKPPSRRPIDDEPRPEPGHPSAEPGLIETAESVSSPNRPSRPIYTVRERETLRTIARKTLGDPHRWDEIRKLNLDQLDGSPYPPIGTRLRLPEDAETTRK
jgi:nucleoid-associated protein YgaU